MEARHRYALADPLQSMDLAQLARHRFVNQAGDGVLLVTILAVDR